MRAKCRKKDIKKVPQKSITGWRLWLFRVVALTVIPTLLFLLLELGLRIVGYGFPAAATIKYELNGRVSYCNNVKFGWRFWPRNIAREFTGFVIPADKPGDTYRIFVLGGSVALGTPEPSFSFSRILQIMLREKYPGINFEVINTAMPAVNSHVVLEIIKDCAKHKGDLFIVYLGNNEVIGPYGAGTVFAPLSSSLSFIRFDKALKAVRLGQLLTNILQRRAQRDLPKIWGGNRMFMENLIRATNPDLQIVYQHYQRNLEDIGRIARKSGAKIIFSTVGSNLKDCPPFASLYQPDMTESDEKKWNRYFQIG